MAHMQQRGAWVENRQYAPPVRTGRRRWTRWWELQTIAHAHGGDACACAMVHGSKTKTTKGMEVKTTEPCETRKWEGTHKRRMETAQTP